MVLERRKFRKHFDLYRAKNTGSGFGAPASISELDTTMEDVAPVVTPDDLVIYFASSRTDGSAKGDNDVWVATRTSTTEPFGTPTNVTELNTTIADRPSFVTRDRCTMYLSRFDRTQSPIATAAYVATISPRACRDARWSFADSA